MNKLRNRFNSCVMCKYLNFDMINYSDLHNTFGIFFNNADVTSLFFERSEEE